MVVVTVKMVMYGYDSSVVSLTGTVAMTMAAMESEMVIWRDSD